MSVDNRATAAHPARVFALGGANGEGAEAVAHLAASELVSEVVIADRDLAAAEAMAAELGAKASALRVDLMDGDALASQVAGYDIMVNSTGPEWKTVIRGLKVAIKAQVDYCDLCLHGPTTQEALALDGEAKAAGITAVVGSGFFGVTNLMMVHAARQLDDAEDLKSCLFMRVPLWEWFDPEATLAEWRESGRVGTGWLSFMRLSSGKVRIYRNGTWTDVEPLENPARVGIPGACQVTAYPVAYPEAVTVPRSLPGVRSVASVIGMYPQELAELYFELGGRSGTATSTRCGPPRSSSSTRWHSRGRRSLCRRLRLVAGSLDRGRRDEARQARTLQVLEHRWLAQHPRAAGGRRTHDPPRRRDDSRSPLTGCLLRPDAVLRRCGADSRARSSPKGNSWGRASRTWTRRFGVSAVGAELQKATEGGPPRGGGPPSFVVPGQRGRLCQQAPRVESPSGRT